MPNQIDKPDIKLVRALQKDFKELYHPKYTASHKEKQMLINIELGIMQLKNLERYILKHYISREEVLGLLEDEGIYKDGLMIFSSDGEQEIISPSRIRNKLRAELRQALTTNVKE